MLRTFHLIAGACLAGTLTLALALPAFAQSERPRPLRAQTATIDEPSLREALRDPEVQAALREHVRGVDTRNPFTVYSDYPLRAPDVGELDDGPLERFRPLSERQLNRLSNRPERDRPERQNTPRRGQLQNIPATPVPADPPLEGEMDGEGELQFNVGRFAALLHSLLRNNVTGYVMRARQNDQTIYTLQWNWAQRPEDAGLGWNPDRRQHVASVSKLITAMGLTRMLDDEGISFDDPIAPYLPDHWQLGDNVDEITFAHLMNHVSGFSTDTSNGSYFFMQAEVAAGVPDNSPGNFNFADYENMNFALCRLLMATIGGYIDTDADFGQFNDVIWNWITINAYANYINDYVFTPAGVSGPVLANQANMARAYAWDDDGQGWDSGSLVGEAAGTGWHMSADEVLDVVGEFRRGGGILSPQRAQEMLDLSYGLNSPFNGAPSELGPYYYKPGRWWNGPPDRQAEQSLVMILPDDIELVILVNSPLGPDDVSLQVLGQTLYLLAITE